MIIFVKFILVIPKGADRQLDRSAPAFIYYVTLRQYMHFSTRISCIRTFFPILSHKMASKFPTLLWSIFSFNKYVLMENRFLMRKYNQVPILV